MQQAYLSQYDLKVLELLSKIHNKFNQKFPFIQESRELSEEQNDLLVQLGTDTPHYKILVSAMAVDTYAESICQIFDQSDSLLEILSICLSCAQKMKHEITKLECSSQTQKAFENLHNSLINMIQSASLFNPNSPYLEIYRSVLSQEKQNLAENIYSSLKQQNQQLKERLKINDQKIIELEIKLTRILQQHQGEVGDIQKAMKNYELKQEISRKQLEIEKMNEEFCIEIEKYNVVYETLKRELQEYKSIEDNVQTVQLIEKLETEIIILREEKEREQMISQELRQKLQILSQANISQPVYSPRSRLSQKTREFSRGSYAVDPYVQPLDQYYYQPDSMPYDGENDDSLNQVRVSNSSIVRPVLNRGYSEYMYPNHQYRY